MHIVALSLYKNFCPWANDTGHTKLNSFYTKDITNMYTTMKSPNQWFENNIYFMFKAHFCTLKLLCERELFLLTLFIFIFCSSLFTHLIWYYFFFFNLWEIVLPSWMFTLNRKEGLIVHSQSINYKRQNNGVSELSLPWG